MNESLITALLLSLKIAGTATLLNFVFGTAAGFVLARGRFVGRGLLDTLMILPMVLPPTVM